MELLEFCLFSWIALEIGMLLTFLVQFPQFQLFLWFGLISFDKGGNYWIYVDFYGIFQIFYPSQATQANSETKDELFNPS